MQAADRRCKIMRFEIFKLGQSNIGFNVYQFHMWYHAFRHALLTPFSASPSVEAIIYIILWIKEIHFFICLFCCLWAYNFFLNPFSILWVSAFALSSFLYHQEDNLRFNHQMSMMTAYLLADANMCMREGDWCK